MGLMLNVSYIRAFAEMLCGIIMYECVMNNYRHKYRRIYYVLCRVFEAIIMALAIYLILTHGNSKWDVIIVTLIVFACYLGFQYPQKVGRESKTLKWMIFFRIFVIRYT